MSPSESPPVVEAAGVFLVATLAAAGVGAATGDPLAASLPRGLVAGAAVSLVFYVYWERQR